jgi:hypothetical protein
MVQKGNRSIVAKRNTPACPIYAHLRSQLTKSRKIVKANFHQDILINEAWPLIIKNLRLKNAEDK